MHAYKRIVESALLHRAAHADVFEVGQPPAFLFVLFGGSGVDQDEYELRARTVVPIFYPVLEGLAARKTGAVVVYVTAPYDVPFARFADHPPGAAATWTAHVLTELLAPWPGLPYFACGFSGGAALALSGLHGQARCFGGAALGADAVPPGFARPAHWREKLRLDCGQGDPVCNHPANRRTADALRARGEAEEFRLGLAARHRLADYATEECLGELIRFAGVSHPRRSLKDNRDGTAGNLGDVAPG